MTTNSLPQSKLVKKQVKTFSKTGVIVDGQKVDITANVRYDDECGNGHNSFSITGEYYEHGKPKTDRYMISCGCVHEAIEQAFPELKPFIKWHLVSSDEPMHYIANTTYHARDTDYNGLSKGKGINLKAARSCAVWPDATLEQLQDVEALKNRLPALMSEFKKDVESLGFNY